MARDIVYWQVDGSNNAASDNLDDVYSDVKAFKGIATIAKQWYYFTASIFYFI